jgi:hypothetical protein
MTQLSEALKEEIRRVERDNERKEHLKENTEYLKNVILKVSVSVSKGVKGSTLVNWI